MIRTKTVLMAMVAGALLHPLMAADSYEVDASHTGLGFTIDHLGFSNFQGRFNEISGSGTWDNDDPSANSITLNIKASSVDTANEKRDKHLRSPDFFDSNQFPMITFESSSFKSLGGADYEVTGSLSMHGVTKEITIPLTKVGEGDNPWGQHVIGFDTRFSINRMDYGINYMPDGLGKEVKLHLSLEAVRQ